MDYKKYINYLFQITFFHQVASRVANNSNEHHLEIKFLVQV